MLNGKHGYGCDNQKQGFGGSGFQGQRGKPSLGCTIRNITPKNFEAHLTSWQHRTHFYKKNHLKFHIKILSNSHKINFNIPNEWWRGKKKNRNKHLGFLYLRTHNEHIFSFLKKNSISRKASNNPLFYLFNR